ncbi:MAG TPA: VanZ family protein [Verrucomicrobiae bacterium]|nr:VanZ family protein [Verrucomicrobiae bacterium]
MTRRDFAKFWLPVILWMALIFTLSTGIGSMQRTSRIIGPLLRLVWRDVSDKTIHDVQVVVRKAGHVTGYAVLGILLLRALNHGLFPNVWNTKSAFFSEAVSICYAISDEFHQSFEPTRYASAWDVLIDALGAGAGLFIVWIIGKLRGRW